jgi:predicted ABC-type ATPase
MKPWLILLAGPNGSGKTTLASTNHFQERIALYQALNLNPDEIAKLAPRQNNALIWSGREMHRQLEFAIAQNKSVLLETTLSGNNHRHIIKRACSSGPACKLGWA